MTDRKKPIRLLKEPADVFMEEAPPRVSTVGPGLSSSERDDFESWLQRQIEDHARAAGRTTASYAQTRLLGRLDALSKVQDRLRTYQEGQR